MNLDKIQKSINYQVSECRSKNLLGKYSRSTRNAWLGGICSGLEDTTKLPVWLWRLIFVVCSLFWALGPILYILLWTFVPDQQHQIEEHDSKTDKQLKQLDNSAMKTLGLTILSTMFFLIIEKTIMFAHIGGLSNPMSWILFVGASPALFIPLVMTRIYSNKKIRLLEAKLLEVKEQLSDSEHRMIEMQKSVEFFDKLQLPSTQEGK